MTRADRLAVAALCASLAVLGCRRDEKHMDPQPAAEGRSVAPNNAARNKTPKKLDPQQARKMDRALGRLRKARDYRFGFEAAKIVYAVSNNKERGTVTAWIQDSGAVIGVVRDVIKAKRKLKQTILWRDNKTTQWDDQSKTVYVTRLRNRATELRHISTDDQKFLRTAGYTKRTNETIAGKSCQVWHNKRQRTTLWRWKGIDLRYENNALKSSSQNVAAKSVVLGAKLPADVFTPPKEYKVSDRTR